MQFIDSKYINSIDITVTQMCIRDRVGDNNSDMKISVMADVGRCDYKKNILPREDSVIVMVRVACLLYTSCWESRESCSWRLLRA